MIDHSPSVTVVLALPDACNKRVVTLQTGARVADLVAASGLVDICMQRTGKPPTAFGIYGRKVAGEHRPSPGDRIELLRALELDPRAARRARARQQR